jgi:multidrug efflux pump subunit AcrB
MLGSRRVTTYIDAGEEYDVILEGERDGQRTPTDLQNIYVRSSRNGDLIPLSNLVTLEEFADSSALNRYNRVRAITLRSQPCRRPGAGRCAGLYGRSGQGPSAGKRDHRLQGPIPGL